MGALQAQDYMQALWAVGSRMHTGTAADIEQAIEDRRIVLTWLLPGTLHITAAEDARWMLKLLAPRNLAQHMPRLKQLGFDDEFINRCKKLISSALQGNKRLSRPSMMALLEDDGISTKNQIGYNILWYMAQTGLICLGPMEAKQQTFVLMDQWLPHSRELSLEESLAELARRYYTGHGPATLHDFAWWAGLTITDARRGLEAAQAGLHLLKIDGVEYWQSADDPLALAEGQPLIHLLPGYDEYLLGYKDRSAVLEAEHAPFIVPGKNGVFQPLLVSDSQIVGIWKRTIKKTGIAITINPFTQLNGMEKSLEEAAASYCRFMGLSLSSFAIFQMA